MENPSASLPLHRDHRRQWRECLYVYPVIARRSRGLSIGVNLNPDKRCSFACLYCQVNRGTQRGFAAVELEAVRQELTLALTQAASGELWKEDRFAATPPELRRINDIAFSGDGEPTCLPDFDQVVQIAADVKASLGQQAVKLVLITNATQLRSPQVQRALPVLDGAGGEIWAKLDAGTDEYFQKVNRPHPHISLATIVENIASVARGRAVVIQTLFFRIAGQAPLSGEIDAYCNRLREILDSGGKIKLVQLHTIARTPAESYASALDNAELDAIAQKVSAAVAPVPVETYYGGNQA